MYARAQGHRFHSLCSIKLLRWLILTHINFLLHFSIYSQPHSLATSATSAFSTRGKNYQRYKLSKPVLGLPSLFFLFLKILFIFRERGRETKRGKNTDVWERHQWVASCMHPNWGPGPQTRHMSWLEIEPVTFCFAGRLPNPLSHASQGSLPSCCHPIVQCYPNSMTINPITLTP